ncbi:hypothetical protein P879_01525, partial [Paragonimus westermani]
GLFHGDGKPTSVRKYLDDLIAELDSLLHEGLRSPGGEFMASVTSQAIICDSSARAYVKRIKSTWAPTAGMSASIGQCMQVDESFLYTSLAACVMGQTLEDAGVVSIIILSGPDLNLCPLIWW